MSLVEGTFHSVDELVEDARSNIEWLRGKLGYSYREVSVLSGMTEKTVWASTAKVAPRISTMAQIIACMGADPRDLTLRCDEFQEKYQHLERVKGPLLTKVA